MYRFGGRQAGGGRREEEEEVGGARFRNEGIYVWPSVTVVSRASTGYLFLAERRI